MKRLPHDRRKQAQKDATAPTDAASSRASIADVLATKGNRRRDRITPSKTYSRPGSRSLAYHKQTRRPIVCLAFVLPLVLLYELGSILLGADAIRTGVDQWASGLFAVMGFGQVAILPIIVTATLITWHHQKADRWSINPLVLAGIILESAVLGTILFWAASACYTLATVSFPNAPLTATTVESVDQFAINLSLLGSGIYEELIFRVLLLVPIITWATWLLSSRRISVVLGMLVCSFVFACLHYSVFNPAGENFEISSFLFRFGASIVFCNLFLFRGFGIAVGSHVIYDLLTQL
jgi:hypothetical protein